MRLAACQNKVFVAKEQQLQRFELGSSLEEGLQLEKTIPYPLYAPPNRLHFDNLDASHAAVVISNHTGTEVYNHDLKLLWRDSDLLDYAVRIIWNKLFIFAGDHIEVRTLNRKRVRAERKLRLKASTPPSGWECISVSENVFAFTSAAANQGKCDIVLVNRALAVTYVTVDYTFTHLALSPDGKWLVTDNHISGGFTLHFIGQWLGSQFGERGAAQISGLSTNCQKMWITPSQVLLWLSSPSSSLNDRKMVSPTKTQHQLFALNLRSAQNLSLLAPSKVIHHPLRSLQLQVDPPTLKNHENIVLTTSDAPYLVGISDHQVWKKPLKVSHSLTAPEA